MTPSAEDLQTLLRSFDARVLERGRDYAARGRVTGVREEVDGIHALVDGNATYEVHLGAIAGGGLFTECTCMAYEREGECKHGAALALVLREGGRGGERPAQTALPPVFRNVYSASKFFSRLALYAGEALPREDELHTSLSRWWWGSLQRPSKQDAELRRHVAAHAAEIERVLDELRGWRPPPPRDPGTAWSALYEQLARAYEQTRRDVRVLGLLPGPLDERHPGFALAFDRQSRLLTAVEQRSPLLASPRRIRVQVPIDPADAIGLEADHVEYDRRDAWWLFALRALLIALDARADEAVQRLAGDLARPLWELVLERLAPGAQARAEPCEWAFCLVPAYGEGEHKLSAWSRPLREGGRVPKWKKRSLETLVGDEEAPALERDIARVALSSASTSFGRPEPVLALGTANGHELARLLARHPRCFVARGRRPDLATAAPARIVAGTLAMHLAPDERGVLAPRFFAGDEPVPIPIADMRAGHGGVFLGGSGAGDRAGDDEIDTVFVSVQVPAALRPWLDAASRMGSAFAFPPEAAPRLAAATERLVASGIVQLPKEALGEELPYAPAAALRVEWLPGAEDGPSAIVEVMIAAHAGAPFVGAGDGPRLFTFEHEGRRVFVERDLAREIALVEETIAAIDAPVTWTDASGGTRGVEATVALAAWLDRNPLGLAIEVKVGRPPQVAQWPNGAELGVTRRGSWLVLDGALDVDGAKLSLGEVLEAVRLARRYVKAERGVFLELSKETIAKLRPIATAAQLVPARADSKGERINDAFGSLLLEARELFDVRARGLDLDEYARRLDARDRRVRVPSLEHGELRPYQREGVAWMLRLATWAPGCVLADDMGLGKTVQTAAVLKARSKLGPALVVAPASVSSNWVAELARFVPSLAVRWYNEDRATPLADLGPRDVLVVSYGLLQRRSAAFAEPRWATVVVDEAQYVKNVGAQRSDAVRSLTRDFTIALTGTPLENHLGELFSIVDVVFPGLLGDEATFRERFRRPIEGGRDGERLAALGRLLAPFLLRRTRGAVLQELPPREDITEYVDLGPEETRRYLALRSACEEQLARRSTEETPAQLRIAILSALTRLRQLACDVRLVDPSFEGPSTKIARAVELACQLAAEGNRALVFSQFTQFLDKVRAALEEAGLRVGYLTGDTPTTKRRAIVDAFQSGEYDVFCVSLLAGGTGLNLTRASYVIHLDPWWNPAAEEQATARAHRMGQTDPVTVYRLVARGTIEEAVLAMHASKRELAAAVLEGKGEARAITSEELLALLRFGA